ncbi:NUDIX domain-containing protein [Microbacterium lushaniae]|uniref:NUDIX hydrolase n=1 Tax=Microbacterium lushaniae TaxID=2614639 RepID=A0A5J6L363_9MICO|nr:NUDIX hydrolase [Microbacterium lushaniae]QEW02732.1 NUDIX hydrolase [Microbacterium lushaniae]
MTIEPPRDSGPRRPSGPRDPGDAWVVAPTGERYWGRFGAAGLLALDARRGVLLQHRVSWSHFGGTWGLPGGARHEDESAVAGAMREATEEAGVPEGAVRARLVSLLDLGFWSYTTVVADVVQPFEPVISDPESVELSWVPVDAVDDYPLHPGFAEAWGQLRTLLPVRPTIVVDAANVVGAVPDGWWRDRAGAAGRLLERIDRWVAPGVAGDQLSLDAHTWFPRVVVVLEGRARDAAAAASGAVEVVAAPASGDDEIAAQAAGAVAAGEQVTVVTSDRGLAERVVAAGGVVHGAGWLLDRLP